ncbi:MAG: hypothetical protein WBF17_14785, partial [Phycisphaerae bacterium]
MTKETRIGLLVGLLFIVAFGLVLSELTGPDSSPPAPAAAEENFASYAHTPVIEEVSLPVGQVTAGRRAPAPTRSVAAVEASLGNPIAYGERAGTIEAEISP